MFSPCDDGQDAVDCYALSWVYGHLRSRQQDEVGGTQWHPRSCNGRTAAAPTTRPVPPLGLAGFQLLLLRIVVRGPCPLNNGFLDILEDDTVLLVIFKLFFVPVRLGVGLKIEDVTTILLQRTNVTSFM